MPAVHKPSSGRLIGCGRRYFVEQWSGGACLLDTNGNGSLDIYFPAPKPPGSCKPPATLRQRLYLNDGRPDIFVCCSGRSTLYQNNGDGTFTDVSRRAGVGLEPQRGLGVAAFDFDGDGRLDLFVANDIGPNFLYHNNGDGTFEDVALQQGVAFGLAGQSQANMGVAVGDYNDTGRPSVLVTTFTGEPYTLYRNEGRYFTDASVSARVAAPTRPFLGFGAGFLDARNLGRLALFFANGHIYHGIADQNSAYTYKERNQIFLNDGAGRFAEAAGALPAPDVRVHRAACFGDIDNDGRVAVLVTANDGRPTLLHNDSAPANWLLLRLTDRHGCATPVGVRCFATVGSRRLARTTLGGGSYGSSDPRVHLGLGAAPAADVEIYWLSGRVQTLKAVKANQILTVREAAGP